MTIGIMQPYFLPYIGYFQLIKAVKKFVIYDDVNYIKGGWINRNNILICGEKKMFTISLKEASPNKLINKIEIADNFVRFYKTVQLNYKRSPYYSDVILLLERIISFNNICLSEFITNSIKEILFYLNINTTILVSSHIIKDVTLRGQDKVIDICKNLNANTYLNAIGGEKLYDKDTFRKSGINLRFLKMNPIYYQQFDNNFIPSLSILDALMFNSPEKMNIMLDDYIII